MSACSRPAWRIASSARLTDSSGLPGYRKFANAMRQVLTLATDSNPPFPPRLRWKMAAMVKLIPYQPSFLDLFMESRAQPGSVRHNPLQPWGRQEIARMLESE